MKQPKCIPLTGVSLFKSIGIEHEEQSTASFDEASNDIRSWMLSWLRIHLLESKIAAALHYFHLLW